MERKTAWEKYTKKQKTEVMTFAEGYRQFISDCKTERECVKEFVKIAGNQGFKDLSKLIEKKTSSTAADSYLTFEGGKKHKLNGVILPTGWYFNYITLQLEVLEWETENASGDSRDLPQATQFAVVGAQNGGPGEGNLNVGNGVKDPYRQQWYFKDGETVSFSFKIMLPVGGSWELEVYGGTEANPTAFNPNLFAITGGTFTAATSETPAKISGNMAESGSTNILITIEAKQATAGVANSLFFKSYVYDKNGNKFNIDSETQLYDRGRGYHTFFVNNEVYHN